MSPELAEAIRRLVACEHADDAIICVHCGAARSSDGDGHWVRPTLVSLLVNAAQAWAYKDILTKTKETSRP